MSVGTRMKERRESLGLTQVQLAEMLGVTKGAIGNYETDANSPKASILYKVFEVLKCDANYLFQDEIRDRAEYQATPAEMEHLVKKYRSLDDYGKEAVNGVLDVEFWRCEADRQVDRAAALREQRRQMEAGELPESENVIRFRVPEYTAPMSAGPGEEAMQEFPEDIELVREPPRGTSYMTHIKGSSMEPTFRDGDMVFVHACQEILVGRIGVFFMDGKQWVKELGDGVLISHNPAYDPIPMRDDIRCQGLVLGVCDESYLE